MKGKKFLLIGVAVLTVALYGCGAAGNSGDAAQSSKTTETGENSSGLLVEDAGVMLKEVATFADDSIEGYNGAFLHKKDEDNGWGGIYDCNGTPIEGEYSYAWDWDYTTAYQDYYILTGSVDDMMITNLMTADGKLIFPETIEGMISRINNHYVEVIFATGTTEDESEAVFYSYTDPLTSMTKPQNGDTLYTGYAQIYNLDTNTYLEGITLSNPNLVEAVGESILVLLEDGTVALYDREGKLLKDDFESGYSYDGCYFSKEYDDKTEIFDENMTLLFTLPEKNSLLANASRNFVVVDDKEGYHIYDREGKELFEEAFYSVTAGNDNYCKIEKEEGGTDGYIFYYPAKTLTEEKYRSVDTYPDVPDYAIGMEGNSYTLFYQGEPLFEKEPVTSKFKQFYFQKYENEAFQYFVFDDRKFIEDPGFASELSDGLLCSSGGEHFKKGLFELVSGKQLLDYVYDDIVVAYGRLYALKDGTWTVYEIESPFRK